MSPPRVPGRRQIEPVTLLVVNHDPGDTPRQRVGRLARRGREILFEYDAAFMGRGLELSPFRLPLRTGVTVGRPEVFGGLMGAFEDSLPDGWGRLLLDRHLRGLGLEPAQLGPLDRLAWVGARGMGALTYEPELVLAEPTVIDLPRLAGEIEAVLGEAQTPELERLIALGGSPQGARPKALVQLGPDGTLIYGAREVRPGFVPYLVKFLARGDDRQAGVIEHAYALMARAAAIEVPETRLLGRTGRRPGFLASRRFDRVGQGRLHLHTLSGLLEVPPSNPTLSYGDLLRVTRDLTRSEAQVREMFRRACFNVLAHNRDDHARNFAFLMDAEGGWRSSPAYDLTLSHGPGGEHTLLVAGEGRQPGISHLLQLAGELDLRRARPVIDEVREAVSRWPHFADEAGLPRRLRDQVKRKLSH